MLVFKRISNSKLSGNSLYRLTVEGMGLLYARDALYPGGLPQGIPLQSIPRVLLIRSVALY